MARHRPGVRHTEAIQELFRPERRLKESPGIADVYEAADEMRLMHTQIRELNDLRAKTKDGHFHYVAKLDALTMHDLEAAHAYSCDCGRKVFGYGGHKQWFFWWLNDAGKAHDTRGEITI